MDEAGFVVYDGFHLTSTQENSVLVDANLEGSELHIFAVVSYKNISLIRFKILSFRPTFASFPFKFTFSIRLSSPLREKTAPSIMGDSEGHIDFQLYRYTPSVAAAVIFIVLFLLTTAFHLYQLIKCRAWYFSAFVLGGICEFSIISEPGICKPTC
jgi:hypothetical protein